MRFPYGASVKDAIDKLQYDLYYVKNLYKSTTIGTRVGV